MNALVMKRAPIQSAVAMKDEAIYDGLPIEKRAFVGGFLHQSIEVERVGLPGPDHDTPFNTIGGSVSCKFDKSDAFVCGIRARIRYSDLCDCKVITAA